MESATTELTRLPGLEVAETKPELKPEHWIERGPSKRLMLFSGRSHPALAQRIAEKLGIQVGDVSLRTFASGETYCRYEESIRGSDLFIVQTSSPPVDQHLMELMIMIDAAKLASAKRITAVLPLYPVLAPGQEVPAARADHREARRRDDPVGRRRPRAHHGPACGPGAGLLRGSRRPHDGAADARAVLPRSRSARRARRGRPRHGPHATGEQVRRDDRRRPGGAPEGPARAQRRARDERHRRHRRQVRGDDRRHGRHRGHARRRGASS